LGYCKATFDVKNDKLSFQIGNVKVEFHLLQTMVTLSLDDTCCQVDVLKRVISREAMTCHSIDNPLKAFLICCDMTNTYTLAKEEYAMLLNASIAYTPRQCPKEVLSVKVLDFRGKRRALLT